MRVHEQMSPEPQTVHPDTPVLEAARLLEAGGFHHLPVVLDGVVVGVVSDRDLKEAGPSRVPELGRFEMNELLSSVRVSEVMSAPARTISPLSPIWLAASQMLEHDIGCLPVVDRAGKLQGMFTVNDVLVWVVNTARPKETPL
jgi:acetoin utilization protein AcuB